MASKQVLEAYAKGAISFFAGEGVNVLLLHFVNNDDPTKSLTVPVPCIKQYAYIDADTYGIDEETLSKLEDFVNEIFKSGIYDKSYNKLKARPKAAPDHDKELSELILPVTDTAVEDKDARNILGLYGYTFKSENSNLSKFTARNYTNFLTDHPEYKDLFLKNKEALESEGIDFDNIIAEKSELAKEVVALYRGIVNGYYLGAMVMGPAGSGKSTFISAMADKLKVLVIPVPMSGGTRIEDLIGMWEPNGENFKGFKGILHFIKRILGFKEDKLLDKIKAGLEAPTEEEKKLIEELGNRNKSKWIFREGPLLSAYYKGYWVVLEEANTSYAEIIAILNKFFDGSPFIQLGTRVYYRHPNFCGFITGNPGYKGTLPFNISLKDRFPKINVPDISKDKFIEWSNAYTQKKFDRKCSNKFLEQLYDFGKYIEGLPKSDSTWHENCVISFRRAKDFLTNVLSCKVNKEEFAAAAHICYTNSLACDSNNSDKLEKLKETTDIKGKIDALFDLYDFKEVMSIVSSFSLSDLNGEEEESTNAGDSEELTEGMESSFSDL